jgi:hypothetical protein
MIEALETRIAPALIVEFLGGQMKISGSEINDCTIIRTGGGGIEVRDGGSLVFPAVNGVVDIDVLLGGPDNDVFLQLAGYGGRTDIVFGSGTNEVTCTSGPGGILTVVGGDGSDTLRVTAAATVGQNITFTANDGSNTLDVNGTVNGGITMTGGKDTDLVNLDGSVGSAVQLRLDDGTNTVNVTGQLDSLLSITGGSGNDVVTVDGGATIEGNLSFRPSTGINVMTVEGTINADVFYTASTGDDTATFAAGSFVEEIFGKLGHGTNELLIAGTVEEDVDVVGGKNADTFTLGAAVNIGQHVDFNLGNGANVFTGSTPSGMTVGSIGGRLEIDGGSGTDDISLGGFTVTKKVDIDLDDGANTVTIPVVLAGGVGAEIVGFTAKKIIYLGGDGVDTIEIESNLATVGPGSFKLGESDDVFTYTGTMPVFSELLIRGGPGTGDSFDGTTETATIPTDIRGVEIIT